ncbi:outer membrane protein assembly factor BamB family protein [Halosimplex sp. J119]
MRRRAFLAAAGTALVAGCGSRFGGNRFGGGSDCSVDGDRNPGDPEWPTATGDRRNTRSVPRDAMPEPPLSVEWTMRVGGHIGGAQPTVADGTVYTTDKYATLYAVDAATGEGTWTAGIEDPSVPVVGEDVVAVAGSTDTLVAFERESGDRRWRTGVDADLGLRESRPTVTEGAVLVPTRTGLRAYDLSTGERRWRYDIGLRVGRHPAVVDGTVYAAGGDAYLHAVDLETGERAWWAKTPGPLETAPAVVDGTVYTAGTDGAVLALDAATGERVWAGSVDDDLERLAVDGGHVYVASDGAMYAFRADDGERCWRFGKMDLTHSGGVAASPDHLYLTSGNDGEIGDETLVALDPESGDVDWRHDGGDYRFTAGPAVVDGAVYAGGVASGGEMDPGIALFKLS